MGVALIHQHPVDAVALLPARVLLVRVTVALLTLCAHGELRAITHYLVGLDLYIVRWTPFASPLPFLLSLSSRRSQLLPKHLCLSQAAHEGLIHTLVAKTGNFLAVTFVIEEDSPVIDPVVLSTSQKLDWEFSILKKQLVTEVR